MCYTGRITHQVYHHASLT